MIAIHPLSKDPSAGVFWQICHKLGRLVSGI